MRQEPEKLTTWKSVSYEYTTHDTPRGQIWVFTDALQVLGVGHPDGTPVHVVIEMPPGNPVYSESKVMKSGQEIYGTDIAERVEPNSRVRVMVSVPTGETEPERPASSGDRFGWGEGDIVITKRPGDPDLPNA